MSIFERFSRLFSADAHAIMDGVEDPVTMLRYAIREMKSVIDADLASIAAIDIGNERIDALLEQTDNAIAQATEKLDVCFRGQQAETLGKSVIRQRLSLENERGALAAQREQNDRARSQRASRSTGIVSTTSSARQSWRYLPPLSTLAHPVLSVARSSR